ncbi:MAG: hypothetical protein JXB49_22165 [Bacteroidales bacterium]|nr:hypothetical protein [Bacteroidales bacterium]
MKIQILIIGIIIGFISLITSSCNPQKKVATYTNHPIECLGVEMDGSQTLKVWGTGRNRFDAVEQAKKTAVSEVLFNGVKAGKADCQVRPVLGEVNVHEKNEVYFNKFFADGGEFLNYISLEDEKISHRILREKQKANYQTSRSVIIRVNRPGLIEKMRIDGILK